MGKKANPTLIGAFVIGAITLAFIGVLVFGSGRLFRSTSEYVIFFPGSVDGLNIGSPVKFKGVEIGSVLDIRLNYGRTTLTDLTNLKIPVFIEIDNEKITKGGGFGINEERVREFIKAGLRAQLKAQSLVTGLLFVELNMHPDMPAVFEAPPGSKYPEIPAIPTTLEQAQTAAQQIIAKLEQIHIDEMVKAATSALDGLDKLVNAPALHQAVEALPRTVDNLNAAIAGVRDLTGNLDGQSASLFSSLKDTSETTAAALEQAKTTLQSVQMVIEPSSPIATQLLVTLDEITRTARSVRLLADFLERNPSAIVRGREASAQ
jgi:paraquat-inducible protein B